MLQPPKSNGSVDARCSVLQRHFTHVVPLLTFIRDHLGFEVSASTSKAATKLSEQQWQRLNRTLVGFTQVSPAHISSQTGPCTTIYEVVQEAQLQILANAAAASPNGVCRSKYDTSNNVLFERISPTG